MSPKNIFSRLIMIFLLTSSLAFSGCSYIPWIGDDDEDDLAFEEEIPSERAVEESGSFEDDFFSDTGSGDGFASTDQGTDKKQLASDVENLQAQQEALSSKVRELQEMINILEPKISATEERLDASLGTVTDRSDFLEPEVNVLKAQVAKLEEEIEALKSKKGIRKKGRKSARLSPEFKAEYEQALDAYRKGNYDESILMFQNLAVKQTPVSYRDNIAFWVGTNYLKLEMYDDAINQFQTVLDKYPRGNKVHDSRYALGVSYYKKGDTGRALDILEAALRANPPQEVRQKIQKQMNEIQ